MSDVRETIVVNAPASKVFNAYVNFIDEWWPRQGAKFQYSFAPEEVQPAHIWFEEGIGGRLYERFSDGSEYEIGRILVWSPSSQLTYTWKAPSWDADTLIQVRFKEHGDRTQVTLVHSGFEALGDPAIAEGYGEGSAEIYEQFTLWVESNAEKL